MKRKHFGQIIDINGAKKNYPLDKNFYTLFFTKDSKFYLYALYTKKDYSTPELSEIDFTTYNELKEAGDVIENFIETEDDLAKLLVYIKKEVILDNINVGQILKLK